jgi:hypothetical protein
MGERQQAGYARSNSRRALATCALLTLPIGACDGVLHPVIHAAVHSTLNEQLQRAGVRQPAPVSEAVEYFCLGDNDRARSYIEQAYRENAPEQLVAVARVLRQIAPMLGQYGERVVPFLDFLSNNRPAPSRGGERHAAASEDPSNDRVASSRDGVSTSGGARCETNLGREGESCTGSPQCDVGLGCVAQVCQRRQGSPDGHAVTAPVVAAVRPAVVPEAQALPPSSTPVAPRPAPLADWVDPAPSAPDALPRLTRAQLNRVMRGAHRDFARCLSNFHGVLAIAMTIEPSGIVSDANVGGDLAHSTSATCIETATMALTFPRFAGASTAVVYPYTVGRAR